MRSYLAQRTDRGQCICCPNFITPGHVRCDVCREKRAYMARVERRMAKSDLERRFGRAVRRLVRLRDAAAARRP